MNMEDFDNIISETFYSYRKSEIGEYLKIKKEKHSLRKTAEFEFKEIPELQQKWVYPKNRASIRNFTTPDTLASLCDSILRKIPMPEAFYWNNTQVLQWIEQLGFPEYKITFFENQISGQNLIFLQATNLQAMNIRSFENIMKIVKNIHALYGIEMIRFSRNISLPPRLPYTHLLHYKGFNGYKYHNTKPLELWQSMKILREPPKYKEHWDLLHQHITNRRWPYEAPNLIGYTPKYKLYATNCKNQDPQQFLSSTALKKDKCNCAIVPCVCDRSYYRMPHKRISFKFLHWINERNEEKLKLQRDKLKSPCYCYPLCTCDADMLNIPQIISILREKLPEKYDTTTLRKTIPDKEEKKMKTGRKSHTIARKSILARPSTLST